MTYRIGREEVDRGSGSQGTEAAERIVTSGRRVALVRLIDGQLGQRATQHSKVRKGLHRNT